MARIILSRKKEWANRARKFNVFIDGEKKDTIANGEIKEIELDPGKHKIMLKVDWCSSPELELDLKEEKSKTIEVCSFKANRWLMPILYIIVGIYFIAKFVYKIDLTIVLYLVLPLTLVYIYYLSFGRKKYIEIEEI
ncbi:MAG: hypothetical protein A2041_01145 [Bacteroidetes bacterium GWA2_31_9b]|nr:MAG: hypothetical protein A2041_01145 [Bacteroidetes bacterium GWA2_31_9b]